MSTSSSSNIFSRTEKTRSYQLAVACFSPSTSSPSPPQSGRDFRCAAHRRFRCHVVLFFLLLLVLLNKNKHHRDQAVPFADVKIRARKGAGRAERERRKKTPTLVMRIIVVIPTAVFLRLALPVDILIMFLSSARRARVESARIPRAHVSMVMTTDGRHRADRRDSSHVRHSFTSASFCHECQWSQGCLTVNVGCDKHACVNTYANKRFHDVMCFGQIPAKKQQLTRITTATTKRKTEKHREKEEENRGSRRETRGGVRELNKESFARRMNREMMRVM